MSLTAVEAAVVGAISPEILVADLIDLMRVPSVTGTAAESDSQHSVAETLRELDMDVDAWSIDVDQIRRHPDFPGDETERTEAHGVVATIGEGEPALVLQGHVDVVPIGDPDRWEHDPWGAHISGDVLHGRGACDMKAGVAANLAVARAIHRSGVRLEHAFAVHAVVSEEDGGLGAFATLQRGHRGEAAVITEPTSGALMTANAGALTFEIRIEGLAAHGSVRRSGVSAVELFFPLHQAIVDLESDRNAVIDPRFDGNPLPYPISVGRVRAGDWASSVPDLLTAEGRMGVILGEDPAEARTVFEAAIVAACARHSWLRDHPVVITWPGGQFASGWLNAGHPLIEQTASAVTSLGSRRPLERAAPYGSDLRLYSGVGGIPTLQYGPGDVRFAHAPREQVSLTETIAVAEALALLVARRCGAHF